MADLLGNLVRNRLYREPGKSTTFQKTAGEDDSAHDPYGSVPFNKRIL